MKSAVKRYLIGQFKKPHGVLGALAGWIMAHRASNRRRNLWTVELMDPGPTDRVLEIGYGPGLALAKVAERVTAGRIVGLDHSDAMRAMARARNRTAVETGRLELLVGSVEDPEVVRDPALAGPFDRIYAINVVMFWQDPVKVLRSLGDRLREGGRIYLTYQPRVGERTDQAAVAGAERIATQMRAAGLSDVRIETLRELSPMAVCVIGTRAAAGE